MSENRSQGKIEKAEKSHTDITDFIFAESDTGILSQKGKSISQRKHLFSRDAIWKSTNQLENLENYAISWFVQIYSYNFRLGFDFRKYDLSYVFPGLFKFEF